jgi:hypothetical protein
MLSSECTAVRCMRKDLAACEVHAGFLWLKLRLRTCSLPCNKACRHTGSEVKGTEGNVSQHKDSWPARRVPTTF